jgi:predicted amidohydrolase YtcJ
VPDQSTLYRNGRVYTAADSSATAFLTSGGRIEWIGTEDEAQEQRATRVVDLQHALVTPAFVDAHVHCTSTGLALTGLDLRHATSLAEALRTVEAAARKARGRPLLGSGWDETNWPEQRPPTALELDRASYGGAVYLARVDKHSAVASSALMTSVPRLSERAGFRPDGWLRRAAHDAVRVAAYEALSAGQRREAQRAALRHAAALGIGCVHEMAGPVISSADDLLSLQEIAATEPAPEVVAYWAELHGTATARELGAVGAAGDLFCDGSLGSHTAALGSAYADDPANCGTLRFATDEVAAHISECAEAGLQFGFHAIGDAAIDQILDAVELVSDRLGRPVGAGQRIEHAEFVRDPDRLARAGLLASMQPRFDELWGGPAGMYAQRLGADRARALNRFADLAAAGVRLAFGSDAPVTELGPWQAVRAAVRPSDATAGLDVAAAFAAHTSGGHRAARSAEAGVLRPSAVATFAIWEAQADPRGDVTSKPTALPDLDCAVPVCLATMRSGVPIFEHDSWSGALGGFGP